MGFMKYNFKNEESFEYQLDAFYKKILHNEVRNAYAESICWNKQQISLDQLTEAQLNEISICDHYETEYVKFHTYGYTIPIKDALLANVVARLSKIQQDIILLSFFLEQSEDEVAKLLSIDQGTLHYHKTKALESLREFLEGANLK